MFQFIKYRRLSSLRKGDVVKLASRNAGVGIYRIVNVRSIQQKPLHPVSFELRPDVIRSRFSAIIQNVKSGRLRTVYHAENVWTLPVD